MCVLHSAYVYIYCAGILMQNVLSCVQVPAVSQSRGQLSEEGKAFV